MKQIFLTLTLLLLTLIPAEAVKKITPNPINLAITLVEKTDSAKIASTLTYYGYTLQNIEDGYNVMKDSNGNEIRYTFNLNDIQTRYPIIMVKTKYTHKSLDSRLKELYFEKKGNTYERLRNMFSKYKTVCNYGPKSTMIVRRIPHNS